MDKFPARMFRWAAIYGVIVLVPLYLTPLPKAGAEVFFGFVGLALVFQGVFWTIGSDPARYACADALCGGREAGLRRAVPVAVGQRLSGQPAGRRVCRDRSAARAGILSGLARLLHAGLQCTDRLTLREPDLSH